jgi:hypothetical protein
LDPTSLTGTPPLNVSNPGKLVFLGTVQATNTAWATIPSSVGNYIAVQVQDMFGHPIKNSSVVIQLTQLSTSGLRTQGQINDDDFGTDGGSTDNDGVAYFSQEVYNQTSSQGSVLLAFSTGLNSAVSNAFDVLPGLATNTGIYTGNNNPGTPTQAVLLLTANTSLTYNQGQNLAAATSAGNGVGTPVIQLYDSLGNVATTFQGTVRATTAFFGATSPLATTNLTLPITALAQVNGSPTGVTVSFVSGNAVFPNLTLSGMVVTGVVSGVPADTVPYTLDFEDTPQLLNGPYQNTGSITLHD